MLAISDHYRMIREFDKADRELSDIEWKIRSLVSNCILCEANSCLNDILLHIATRRKVIAEAEASLLPDCGVD